MATNIISKWSTQTITAFSVVKVELTMSCNITKCVFFSVREFTSIIFNLGIVNVFKMVSILLKTDH